MVIIKIIRNSPLLIHNHILAASSAHLRLAQKSRNIVEPGNALKGEVRDNLRDVAKLLFGGLMRREVSGLESEVGRRMVELTSRRPRKEGQRGGLGY